MSTGLNEVPVNETEHISSVFNFLDETGDSFAQHQNFDDLYLPNRGPHNTSANQVQSYNNDNSNVIENTHLNIGQHPNNSQDLGDDTNFSSNLNTRNNLSGSKKNINNNLGLHSTDKSPKSDKQNKGMNTPNNNKQHNNQLDTDQFLIKEPMNHSGEQQQRNLKMDHNEGTEDQSHILPMGINPGQLHENIGSSGVMQALHGPGQSGTPLSGLPDVGPVIGTDMYSEQGLHMPGYPHYVSLQKEKGMCEYLKLSRFFRSATVQRDAI